MADLGDVEKELRELLGDVEERTLDRASQGLRDAMDEFEALSVELAPIDKGNLEASTGVRFFKRGGTEVGLLEFSASYASIVHELPNESRGPRTRRKPGNELGKAGPKYVERPLRHLQKIMPRIIGEEIS